MKIEFHSLHWNNVDAGMLAAHKSVMRHFDIPMQYHAIDGINHGEWMTDVLRNSSGDITVFLEPDCVPVNETNVVKCLEWVYDHDSFLGIAQVSNHIPPKSHIYAAPGFYCMTKEAYRKLGQPSLVQTARSDVAEEVSYRAEHIGLRYRALRPDAFERQPTEGLWPLGCLGYYGIGTVFENTVYHLFQSRFAENIDLFVRRCDQIVKGGFSSTEFTSSTTYAFKGHIVS